MINLAYKINKLSKHKMRKDKFIRINKEIINHAIKQTKYIVIAAEIIILMEENSVLRLGKYAKTVKGQIILKSNVFLKKMYRI